MEAQEVKNTTPDNKPEGTQGKEKETRDTNKRRNSIPDWWVDNYTDGSGNCYSDADPGL